MFDFHLHTKVSFDGIGTSQEMAEAALKAGLKEICFTDHVDYHSDPAKAPNLISMEEYSQAYDHLEIPGLTIRKGFEYGLTTWNQKELKDFLEKRPFDFVIGSVHFADGYDPYDKEYWVGKTVEEAFRRYLEVTLECVKVHDEYDVLGHLTYVCKSVHNPTHEPVLYKDFQEITDEILRILVKKGKGMEINSSGVDRAGDFLPSADFLRRFHELGGEIITIGSDAHAADRVGQYHKEALEIVKDIFGHVCTFENRKVVFHKL